MSDLTPRQAVILQRLREHEYSLTISADLAWFKAPGEPWSMMGYDRAYAAVERLVNLGLARRLSHTRPAQYKAVRDA